MPRSPMTLRDVHKLPTVLTVERAGQLLGLGRTAAYEAVNRGEIPIIRLGRRVVVPTARVLALLGLHPTHEEGDEPRPGPAAKSVRPHQDHGDDARAG